MEIGITGFGRDLNQTNFAQYKLCVRSLNSGRVCTASGFFNTGQ